MAVSWTSFPLHGSARKVYVNASQPDDTGDGLSEVNAKQTIQAGLALVREGFGDQLLLKRGETWSGGAGTEIDFTDHGGLSATYPTLIGSYGSGAALINSVMHLVEAA